jgi:AraC-like DNA-binding protein
MTCGLRLQIGALPSITALPADEFTDRSIPLDALSGNAARVLASRLEDANKVSTVVGALFAFVAESSNSRSPMYGHEVFRGVTRVAELARRVGASPRTVYERIVASVGLSPKCLLRVERMHRALEANARGESWSFAALEGGFADQPHLVREARRLLGETPREWKRRAALPIRSRLRAP